MPLAMALCGWINRTMYICFIFPVLCSLSGWGSGVGNLQCVAHTSYSLYYKQIFSLLHLNFCSISGMISSLPALKSVPVQPKGCLWVTVNKCMPSGAVFSWKVCMVSISTHFRQKIGGFQRLTSVLWWWPQQWGLEGKVASVRSGTEGGCCLREEKQTCSWKHRGLALLLTLFPSLIWIPLCLHQVTLVVAFWTSWGEWCRQVLSASRASVTVAMEGGIKCQCVDVKLLWKRRKTYLMQFFYLYSVFCHTAFLGLAVSFRSLLHRSLQDFKL